MNPFSGKHKLERSYIMTSRLDLQFVVEPSHSETDAWTVRMREGQSRGKFPSRLNALRLALSDANRVSNMGHRVQVFAKRSDGSLRRVAERPLVQ
jgi:hypothetical protein